MLNFFFICILTFASTSNLPSTAPLVVEDRFAKLYLKPVEINSDGQNKCDVEPAAFLLPYTPTNPAYVIWKGVSLPLPTTYSSNLVLTVVSQQGRAVAIEPSYCLHPLRNINQPDGSTLIYLRYTSSPLTNYYGKQLFIKSFDTIERAEFPVIEFLHIGVEVVKSIIEPQPLPQYFALPTAYGFFSLYPIYTRIDSSLSAGYYAVRVLGQQIELMNALKHNYGSGTCLLLTMDVVLCNGYQIFDDRTGKIGLYVIDKQDALPLDDSFGSHFNIFYQFNVVNGK